MNELHSSYGNGETYRHDMSTCPKSVADSQSSIGDIVSEEQRYLNSAQNPCNVSDCSRYLVTPPPSLPKDSKCRAGRLPHSLTYYFSPNQDHLLQNWTRLLIRVALLLLPIVWIMAIISWTVYLAQQTNSNTATVLDADVDSPPLLTLSIHLTILAAVSSVLIISLYVIHSNWAYSFVFIPNVEDEDDYRVCMQSPEESTTSNTKFDEKLQI